MRSPLAALLTLGGLIAALGLDAYLHASAVDGRHHDASCAHTVRSRLSTDGARFGSTPVQEDASCPPCLLQSVDVTATRGPQRIVIAGRRLEPVATSPWPGETRVDYLLRGPPAA